MIFVTRKEMEIAIAIAVNDALAKRVDDLLSERKIDRIETNRQTHLLSKFGCVYNVPKTISMKEAIKLLAEHLGVDFTETESKPSVPALVRIPKSTKKKENAK